MGWSAKDIPDQSGRVAVVTGANSGIGLATAKALAGKGARVVLACRDTVKGEAAAAEVGGGAEALSLDLASFQSIRLFAGDLKKRIERLDLLINNAGVMTPPEGRTADGFELQFGTNHLGHFMLVGALLDVVCATPGSRVVTVSSLMHRSGQIDFDNLNAEKGYSKKGAYSQSKLCNLMFALELHRRLNAAGQATLSVAAHPGWTATNLQVNWPAARFFSPLLAQGPAKGALPTLYAATAKDVLGGSYYGPKGLMELGGAPALARVSDRARDAQVAARLWRVSEGLTGVDYLS